MKNLESGLYIISTPIGNLEDITFRAKKILSMVDYIVCENPKHSLKLLNNLGIKKKLFSLHDYNEGIIIKRLEKYQNNASIAIISDAGSPLISDPGYNLVLDYINKGIKITTIPGPSAIIAALQLSGIAANSFTFFGFIPKNKKLDKTTIEKIKNSQSASIFFAPGKRLISFLEGLIKEKINSSVSVCKEITKKNEKVFRGNITEIVNQISEDKNNIKGEFVVVIEGIKKKNKSSISLLIENEISKLLIKFSLTEVVEIVHKLTNISKKEIYKAALKVKE